MSESKEKLPLFQRSEPRIVGKAPKEEKEKAKKIFVDAFGEKHLADMPKGATEKIRELEYEKKPYEMEAIELANKITNDFLTKYGLTPFDIPDRNIHYIPPELYKEVADTGTSTATTVHKKQAIFINTQRSRKSVMGDVGTLLHEIIHLKEHVALEIYTKKKDTGEEEWANGFHRSGLSAVTTGKKAREQDISYTALRGLNEAVVSTLHRKYTPQILSEIKDPQIQEEMNDANTEEFIKYKQKIADEQHIPLEWLAYANPKTEHWNTHSHYQQQRVLDFIIKCAQEDGSIENYDQGLDLFAKAHFTGHLVGIAKLIEKTFGKNTFKALAMNDEGAGEKSLDYLHKVRRLKK